MEKNIKYLVVDVDGTMTDAGVYYDEFGNELKKFCTRDAAGFFAAKTVGIKIIVMTGRKCNATLRRMNELHVDYIFQNVKNKHEFLKKFMFESNITKEEIGFIGDDLNDLAAMRLVGFIGCPVDSCNEIIAVADYISSQKGGQGAVRDIMEHLLRKRDEWEVAVEKLYYCGI